MTDRELLELAAKAAGMDVRQTKAKVDGLLIAGRFNGDYFTWNPLTDDGDALRLAVALKIDVWQCGLTKAVLVICDIEEVLKEKYGKDPYAATRRAIVRAAAEIGRGMG